MSETDRQFAQQARLQTKLERREAESFAGVTSLADLDAVRLQRTQEALRRAMATVQVQSDVVLEEKQRYNVLSRSLMHDSTMNQSSKAVASTFYHQIAPAHDAYAAANVHHTGSHYVMAGSKQFQKGVRVKGVVSRHSKQAAKRNGQNTTNGVHNKKDGSMSILT